MNTGARVLREVVVEKDAKEARADSRVNVKEAEQKMKKKVGPNKGKKKDLDYSRVNTTARGLGEVGLM